MSLKNPKKKFTVIYQANISHGLSHYRLVDPYGNEVVNVNDFLDALATRGLSILSLRTYSFGLLKFWTWLIEKDVKLCDLAEANLFEFIRFLHAAHKGHSSKIAPATINHRITIAESFYRYHTGQELPIGRGSTTYPPLPYHTGPRSEIGYLHPRRPSRHRLRVKAPRRIVVPLTREEVGTFFESLRSWRDLSITGLMLLCGLRSREVLQLTLLDLLLSEGQMRIMGKGNKERILPLPSEVLSTISTYLSVERPKTTRPNVFVCLKGKKRGASMTPEGLRAIFRYHRKRSQIPKANPHRFRHTFGADMVRAGMSLPALMRLMGHVNIRTTMLYVELSPKDVWEEFHRVIRRLNHKPIPRPPHAQE